MGGYGNKSPKKTKTKDIATNLECSNTDRTHICTTRARTNGWTQKSPNAFALVRLRQIIDPNWKEISQNP